MKLSPKEIYDIDAKIFSNYRAGNWDYENHIHIFEMVSNTDLSVIEITRIMSEYFNVHIHPNYMSQLSEALLKAEHELNFNDDFMEYLK